jgi:probable HAF family extracellular repeat protein
MNSLGTLGGTQSAAFDINDSGQVVGGAQNASGYFRPFRWQSGTMTNLGTLGGETINPDHRAEAVNTSGDVAGRSYTAGGAKRAFFYDGAMTDLGVLTGGTESWAFGVNDSQVVVGTSNVSGGAYHAFVWDAVNGMRDLNDLDPGGSGWTLTRATDINEGGFIVGWGTNGSSNVRAFLLTPTCKAGGGAAAVAAEELLVSGSGITDVTGVYDQVVVDSTGEPLAEIELITAEEGSRVQYEVTEPISGSETPDQPDTTPPLGFDDGKALGRRLKVVTTAIAEESILTVSLRFTLEEIAELETAPTELELHVLDPLAGGSPGVWVPAGKDIGESPPTTTIGESGRTTHGDGTVDYWCVRDSGGEFAVGKPIEDDDDHAPRPTPRGCGAAMVPFFLFCAIALTLLKRRR